MAVSVKVDYPEPQVQPRAVGAVVAAGLSINLSTNEVVFSVQETVINPDGTRAVPQKTRPVTVLLSDAQLKAFLTTVLTEAQAQGKVATGSTLTTSVG